MLYHNYLPGAYNNYKNFTIYIKLQPTTSTNSNFRKKNNQ